MPERNAAIDLWRVVAIFGIVVIHAEPFMRLEGGWHTLGLFLDAISRFAVPFFFLTSGYLFAGKILLSDSPKAYYRKYASKLLKLYFIWQALYLLYDAATLQISGYHTYRQALADFQAMGLSDLVKIPVGLLYYGLYSSGYHLWFLTSLVACIAVIYHCHRRGWIKRLLAVSAVLHVVGIIGESYLGGFPRDFMARDALFFGLFYTTSGFALFRYREIVATAFAWPRSRFLWLIAGSALTQYAERTWLTVSGDYSFATAIGCGGLFLMLMRFPDWGRHSVLSRMGRRSVGIYLVHLLFLNAARLTLESLRMEEAADTLLWSLLLAPAVFLLSYAAAVSGSAMNGLSFRYAKKTRRRAAT
ncbi:acyltransferase [Cohnella boryungensis]|uniref:Acyltransferase n=1 Tax=Cohnella boryungensis TaxID=768479 RepID=A0ABV8S4H1_9BACL